MRARPNRYTPLNADYTSLPGSRVPIAPPTPEQPPGARIDDPAPRTNPASIVAQLDQTCAVHDNWIRKLLRELQCNPFANFTPRFAERQT